MERRYGAVLLLSLLQCIQTAGVQGSVGKAGLCESRHFRCSDGQCVSHSSRCDNTMDCDDGSDEENCDQNECMENNGGCSHLCVDQTPGVLCDCPAGMRLIHDTQCEEVDPCLDADVCDQLCVQSNGTFTCDCRHGYVKSTASGRCLATGEAAVILSSSEGLIWMDGSGSNQRRITNGSGSGGAVTGICADHTLYWTDTQHSLIYRRSLDQSAPSASEIHSGSGGIVGLAVDWIHHHLYWISNRTGSVYVAALSGSEPTELISGLSNPKALAIHPLLRWMFWADGTVTPRIERSGLDGHNRKSLITSTLRSPVSITLDFPRDLLYWVDSGLKIISRVTYNGLQRKTIVESNGYLDQPAGLAVFEDRVYWTDAVTESVCSADKHTGEGLQVIRVSLGSPAGFFILHPLLQPTDVDVIPAEAAVVRLTSVVSYILPLIVLCLLGAAVGFWWRRTGSPHISLPAHSLKESRDPLVPAVITDAPSEKEQHTHQFPTQNYSC